MHQTNSIVIWLVWIEGQIFTGNKSFVSSSFGLSLIRPIKLQLDCWDLLLIEGWHNNVARFICIEQLNQLVNWVMNSYERALILAFAIILLAIVVYFILYCSKKMNNSTPAEGTSSGPRPVPCSVIPIDDVPPSYEDATSQRKDGDPEEPPPSYEDAVRHISRACG